MTQESTNQHVAVQISMDWFRILSIVMAGVGFLSLLPLAWAKYTHATNICPLNSGMDCELVVRSVYSQIGPLPVSYLGLIGLLFVLVGLLIESLLPHVKILVFGLTLFGVLFSAYLIAIQAFVLHVWCQVCVQVALVLTSLFILALIRLWRATGTIPEDDDLENEIA